MRILTSFRYILPYWCFLWLYLPWFISSVFKIDGVFHNMYFLFCPWIQTADCTPLPVHTPTLRKKACPGSTGLPPKVLNLVMSMVSSENKKKRENGFLLLVFPVIFIIGFLKITNTKAWKENKFCTNGNHHHWARQEECKKFVLFPSS